MPSSDTSCGLSWLGHPKFLQKYATTKSFIVVYGILGTFQAMGYVYFMMTLQTIENRFKIPSQTTGLILSGNEVSQILLSVILAYFGGQRNRPRFIAWGVVFCSLSCFILAMPHFIFGAGEDALKLTKEWFANSNVTSIDGAEADKLTRKANRLCVLESLDKECNDEIESILPLILIFLSQFVLGIGNTLYYALGQTYLDDNTKKTNSPLLMSYAFTFRTLGPAIGFGLGYACLKLFIDPTKTPLIDNDDPRWMGAWWLGWCFLGCALMFCAFFIGMFPKDLPKKRNNVENNRLSSTTPKMLKNDKNFFEEERPLQSKTPSQSDMLGSMNEVPTLKQFPSAMKRLFKNKILMFNSISAIFYILGASAYFTFMSKYMEVQFHRKAEDAMAITGPFTMIGMIAGLLGSGYVISKKKPSPSKLLGWNVFVGIVFMAGELSYLGMSCPDDHAISVFQDGKLNLTSQCNQNCFCSTFAYTPVCMEETSETFFNPCVAGCNKYSKKEKIYYECECALSYMTTTINNPFITKSSKSPSLSSEKSVMSSTTKEIISTTSSSSSLSTTLQESTGNSTISISTTTETTPTIARIQQKMEVNQTDYDVDYDLPDDVKIDEKDDIDPRETAEKTEEMTKERKKRSMENPNQPEKEKFWGKLTPGACLRGCTRGFFAFAIVSSVINLLGISARIGNLLVNYRCVSKQDKSVTQGLILMLISLFALIPGPIMYGKIIDTTCLVWTEQCSGSRGNCQLYDQRKFRYYINLTAFALTTVGVFFDILVWKYGRNLDLYGEREEEMLKKQQKRKNWSENDTKTIES